MDNTPVIIEFVLRWIHFIAGIIWIGHLYFFNFVNGIFAKTLDAETKKKVVPELMPRALFWFRWGAMFTWITGVSIILYRIHRGGMEVMSSSWGQWIGIGAVLGTIMWFNVWFIIWPAQKKIIPAIKAGNAPDAKLVANAMQASKINTYLSVPLLFCMGAASHLPFITPIWIGVCFVVGFGIVWKLYKIAPNVGKM